jgi:hypothetical protein
MRLLGTGLLILGVVLAALPGQAQKPAPVPTPRYGVEPDLRRYPQATPQEALGSVLQAIDRGQIFYLVAHLADPRWVDEQVARHKRQLGNKGPEAAREQVAFDQVVQEVRRHWQDEPVLLRDLRQLHAHGEWQVKDQEAIVRAKGVSRQAFFRKIADRWYLENRQQKD